jgi:hypothetical protein
VNKKIEYEKYLAEESKSNLDLDLCKKRITIEKEKANTKKTNAL